MKKEQVENLLLIAVKIGQAFPKQHPFVLSRNLGKLQKLAVSLHKRYEAACSYEWACTEVYEAQTEKLEAKVKALSDELGIGSYHQRDPRGASVCLVLNEQEFWLF